MRTIRSLLWIGSGRGLAESGMTEAPELDVTWVPSIKDAIALPRVHFDGILVEASSAKCGRESLVDLERHSPGTSILVCLPKIMANEAQPLSEAGAAAVLYFDPERPGPGIVSEINQALDDLRNERACPPSTPPGNISRLTPVASPDDALKAEPLDPPEPGDASKPRIIARSQAMQAVSELVELAASSPSTVLVTGETGVGKEVIAQQLHARSCREEAPFIAINCAAFPESLLESELFGHTKGAFTGADRSKAGLFEAAGTGTLFLDEIAEMGLSLQAKLLRVLQEREIRPVGGVRSVKVKCRIVAATNRVLADEVRAGRFREDLFYRLNVFPIRVPPLRERRSDILPLAHHFLALHGPREDRRDCHLSLASGQLLEGYGWPGNVRELENEILRALMLTPTGELITPKSLSAKIVEILEPIARGARPDETLREALDRVEAWMIRRALTNNGGRRARTALKLGLTREGLYKKMKRLNVE
jgi:transcriptional regulator with GAF, ATPase, and Fis domain